MITETYDMGIVNSILTHPLIWPDIAPGDVEPFDAPYCPGCVYFLMDDGAGVIVFHMFRDGMKIHPNILPKHRGKQAYKAVEESIQAMFEMGCVSIYAEIELQLRHVISFAKALGFKWIESNDRELYVRRNLDS